MEQMLARLAELKAEGDAIMQQLIAAGMPPEQIMAAVQGGGQQMPQTPPEGMNIPAMGGQLGPDLPAGIPQGGSPMPMNGGGMPRGLLGPG
jgi:hypothetical protein